MSKNPLKSYRAEHGLSLDQLGVLFQVNKSTVFRWEETKVPAERVLEVERKTGISRELLRPDLYARRRRAG